MDSVVSVIQSNEVISHLSMAIYCFVQFTITVIAIHLEFVGFHGIQLFGSNTRC
jgi:hypothetical protein